MRRIMSVRQLDEVLAPGFAALRFVAVQAIDLGGGKQIQDGADITDLVRGGAISEDCVRSHVKRSVVLAVQSGNRAGLEVLRRIKPDAVSKDTLRSALTAAGVQTPPAMPHDMLRRAYAVVLSMATKQQKVSRNVATTHAAATA